MAAAAMTDHVDQYHQAEADRYEHLQRAGEAADRKAAAVRAMHREGRTWADIARLLGVTPQRVHALARRFAE